MSTSAAATDSTSADHSENQKDAPPAPNDHDFGIVKEFPHHAITQIRERYYNSWNVANIYVVHGTRKDLIVDTGIGLWDLPSFLRQKNLIDTCTTCSNNGEDADANHQQGSISISKTGTKPHLAVATHVHFDHSGGLHQFDEVAIHTAEANALESGDSYQACCFMSRCECGKPPSANWKPKDYKLRPTKPTRILTDGDVIDLGNRKFKVIHLPGHSRGSVGLFDEDNGIFFSGDVIYQGPMLDYLPYSSVSDNIKSMEVISTLANSDKVTRVFPGHGNSFDGNELKSIVADYLRAFGTCHDCTACLCKPLFRIVLKGRNTKEPCPNCCYYSCCCCLCL